MFNRVLRFTMLLPGLLTLLWIDPALATDVPRKQVALIAGPATHTFGEHEHYAGLKLLADLLNESVPAVQVTVYKGWPDDPHALTNVAAVLVYA
ncbi:MAG: hypothetical protein WCN95_15270, partial [bacterium]